LKSKIKKHQKKIAKKEGKIDALNTRIKKFKKSLREREDVAKKKKVNKSKTEIKKEKSLIPETEKKLSKVKKTEKTLVPVTKEKLSKPFKKKLKEVPVQSEPEDLKVIEGIGEKTEKVLKENGIRNYLELANCSSETLDDIVRGAFPNYRLFNTLTWPEQALLAHNGQWEELKKLQEKLQ